MSGVQGGLGEHKRATGTALTGHGMENSNGLQLGKEENSLKALTYPGV